MGIAEALIAIMTNAPALIEEVRVLYGVVRDDLSSNDIATVDAALAAITASDWAATQRADDALEAAAKR